MKEIASEKPKISWVNTIYLIGVPVAFLALLPWALSSGSYSWPFFLYALVHYILEGLSITGGYHRLFAHKSYEAHPLLKAFYLFFGAGAMQRPAIRWAQSHRRHHRDVDTDKDPYNIKKGFFWAHMGWIFYHDPLETEAFPPDLAKDKWLLWQEKYYMPLAFFVCFGLPLIFGFLMGDVLAAFVWGALFRVLFTSHCTYFVNSLAHYMGTKPYNLSNSARDNYFVSFLTFGEGYHNFHHKFQADYRNGTRWYHWDPTKWFVASLQKLKMTWNLRKTHKNKIIAALTEVKMRSLEEKGVDISVLGEIQHKLLLLQESLQNMKKQYVLSKGQMLKPELKAFKTKIRETQKEFKRMQLEWTQTFQSLNRSVSLS